MNRANYVALNGPAIEAMLALKPTTPAIGAGLRALVEIRVSQINGCGYCIHVHTQEARAAGETQARLDALGRWAVGAFFTAAEKAALAWAESVTDVSHTGAPDADYDALGDHFSEVEIVDLTLIIAQMNAWNRLAIAFRHEVGG